MSASDTLNNPRLYTQSRKNRGLCLTCGGVRAIDNATYCEKHRDDVAARQRNRRMLERAAQSSFPEELWSKALDAFIK